MDLGIALEPAETAQEHNAHDNHQDAQQLGDPPVLRTSNKASQLPERPAEQHEYHGEAEDEEPDSGQHAAAPLFLQVDAGQSRDVAQVSGHERKDARREE